MMDRLTLRRRRSRRRRSSTLSLRQSADLCARWHGRDGGRLRYAFTPRFAVSCSADMLRESAALAAATGAYWQTHLVGGPRRDRARWRGCSRRRSTTSTSTTGPAGSAPRTILAHAIHLSDREMARLAETDAGSRTARPRTCSWPPGAMPLARYLAAGMAVGLGLRRGGRAGPRSSRDARRGVHPERAAGRARARRAGADASAPLDWLRLGTLDGARVLGLDERSARSRPARRPTSSRSTLVSPRRSRGSTRDDPAELMRRLMFRPHPDMVRGAWVRGRRLDGPERRSGLRGRRLDGPKVTAMMRPSRLRVSALHHRGEHGRAAGDRVVSSGALGPRPG